MTSLTCPGCRAVVPHGDPHECATHSWVGACDRCSALEASRPPRRGALQEALQRAIEAIEHAEPNLHSPWCNGVHEGTACEGDHMMVGFLNYLRGALATSASVPDHGIGTTVLCGSCGAEVPAHECGAG